jgi:molecular chaperone GrpE
VLEAAGVTEIEALGLPFDPERHEAVTAAPGPEGRVIQVTRRGYVLQDRVIRPASVVVGSGDGNGK